MNDLEVVVRLNNENMKQMGESVNTVIFRLLEPLNVSSLDGEEEDIQYFTSN